MPHISDTLKAVLWMICATLSFSVMAVAGREISSNLDTFEIMLYRSVLGGLIILSALTILGRWNEVTARNKSLHIFRNIGHFAGQNLWFYGVATIPLAQVFALEFTTPLWIALLAPIFLDERWTRTRSAAILLGFTGVLLVAQPGRVEISPGVFAAASAALGFTISILSTKALGLRGHSTLNILLWMTMTQTLFGLICAGYDGNITLPGKDDIIFIIAIGVGGLTAHFCFTSALKLAPASLVSPMDFIRLPLIGILGWALYGETVNLIFVAGAALIVTGNIINIRDQKPA